MRNRLIFIKLLLLALVAVISCAEDEKHEEPDQKEPESGALPVIKLLEVNPQSATCVYIEGQITDPGRGCENAARGICWGTSPDPTIADNKTYFSNIYKTNSGPYISGRLHPLCSGITYYVRTYVTYGSKTEYSNQLSFQTSSSGKPEFITAVRLTNCTAAQIMFDIVDDGGLCPITQRGVCLSTSPDPTTDDYVCWTEQLDWYVHDRTFGFCCEARELQPGTSYYARGYITNSEKTYYGENFSFTTSPGPEITTVRVNEITATSAKVTGNVTSTGGSFVISRGIIYDTVPDMAKRWENLLWANQFIEKEVQSIYYGSGEFTLEITNLIPGKHYYVSTFVQVMAGLDYGDCLNAYGEEITFNTEPGK